MPCFSEGPLDSTRPVTPKKITMENDMRYRAGKFEAMLCGVMTAMEKIDHSDSRSWVKESVDLDGVFVTVIDEIDYKEGGFTKAELLDWFEAHVEEDRQRREKEKAEIIQKIDELQALLAKFDK